MGTSVFLWVTRIITLVCIVILAFGGWLTWGLLSL